MKTCAEVLEVPIVVVTSNESVPSLLFVPEKFSAKSISLLHSISMELITTIPQGKQRKVGCCEN